MLFDFKGREYYKNQMITERIICSITVIVLEDNRLSTVLRDLQAC